MKIMQFLIATISLIFFGIVLASILVANIENPIKILIAFSIIIVVNTRVYVWMRFLLREVQKHNLFIWKMLLF